MATINDTLDYLIKAVVTDDSSVIIESTDNEGIVTFEVTAAPEIIGQIIGKEGKVIKSIRTIFKPHLS